MRMTALRWSGIAALVLLPLVARPAASGSGGAPAPAEAKVTEVAPGVFFLEAQTQPAFLGSNSGWVELADGVVAIDASFPVTARIVVAEIRRRTSKPIRFVFDTHYHADHAFGNSVFCDAGAIAVATAACARDERARNEAAFQADATSSDPGRRAMVEGARWQPSTLAFDDRLVFDDGERRLELLRVGPAHTRGDAVAWLPREGILFTGDVCVNGAWNYMGDGDSARWVEALDRLAALEPRIVCPGHGAVADGGLLALQRRWIAELRDRVTAGLEQQLAPEAIAATLDLPWYEQWTGRAAREQLGNVRDVHAALTGRATPPWIADLALPAGPSPTRDTPGWSAPAKVVVVRASGERLAELRAAAPELEVVAAADAADAARKVVDADGVIGALDAAILEAGTKLRWAQVGSAGVERYLGLPGLSERALTLTNAQRIYGPEIADHAVGMLLALTRALPAALENQRAARSWRLPAAASEGMIELQGRTALVCGLGGIGREVARRLQGFGMRVLATNPPMGDPPPGVSVHPPGRLLELAPLADAVFVCVPLTAATERMCDERFFAALKPGARLVNVARGRCVDTGALLAALESGRLAGAGLDVTDPEPLPPDHPLWRRADVIVTPHDAATSDGAGRRQFELFRENLRRFAQGRELLNVVDLAKGY